MSVIVVSIVGLFAVVASAGAQSGTLSSEARRVHDYLIEDWSKHMHSTDIVLAMENLGMEPSDDIRMELGGYFRENKHLANNLKWWGPNNYILSSEEKRIAKQIINTHELDQRLPSIQELAENLNIPAGRLEGRIAFMKRAGLLTDTSEGRKGYALADKYARWGGPLRYNFHTVTVGDGKPFGVWWAVDFLLVVTGDEYQKDGDSFRLDDSCAHCSKPITVEVRDGKISHADPETVWVQQGGGWAVDNLFWSEEHLQDWLNENVAYKRLRHLTIGDFLAKLEAGEIH